MHNNSDADLTLPSVVAALPGRVREQELLLTIVFHPDTTRIGETAVVQHKPGSPPWILGRRGPAFGRDGRSDAFPLADQYISRQALEFAYGNGGLVVGKVADSSRCRVAGGELGDSMELDREQLLAGVPLLLAHTVVLLLRLGERAVPSGADSHAGELLRGDSAYMAGLREQIAQVAGTDLDVLVRGETGTGKELVAGAIHQASRRAAAPLVNVNMAAIPDSLAAAALFGTARGAFTGADRANVGFFQQAQGGTLLLDEIGDTPVLVQPLLLRALQQREIQCVGGPVLRVDVRVISATDAALDGEGCDFKAALRHRLGACEIVLLPLRQHPEDIGGLLLYFLVDNLAELGRGGLLPQEQSDPREIAAWAGMFHSFLCHRWPGNVRELANFAGQVALASESHLTVPDHIAVELRGDASQQVAASGGQRRALRKMQEVGEEEFGRAMELCRYEAAPAARKLGVSRPSVYRRIELSPDYRLAGQVPEDELSRTLEQHGGDIDAAAMHLRVSLSGLRSRLRDSPGRGIERP
jgi:two-component system nitrogen regulation response regulator GlnG